MCGLSREKLSNFSKIENCKEIFIQEFVPCDNHMIYGSWDMKCNRQNYWAIFWVTLGHFLPFHPPNSLKNEDIKMKKAPGDFIILYKCAKNGQKSWSYAIMFLRYGAWRM